MLIDTTYLIDFHTERQNRRNGPAVRFASRHRSQQFTISVISLGEFAAGFDDDAIARNFLARFRCFRLTPEIAYTAAAIERLLLSTGSRLGENDNWIAATARYYGLPVVSNDEAFDRVPGLRRIHY